jgi:DNA polymerase I-like protein with 3'-5' exonuclease and polymerase domains
MRSDGLDKDQIIAAQMNEPREMAWNIPTQFPDLSQYKQIAVDLETCDPNLTTLGPGWARKDGFIVGIAVAAGDWEGYFPIRHANGHNLDAKMTMKWLRKQMATPHVDKIMHNATYDLGWLRAEGVEVQGRIIDTMITAAIVDENRPSYSLNNLGRDYLGERKNEKLLRVAAAEWGLDPKAEMYKLPPVFVGRYAEQDAGMTLRLWERLKIDLKEQDLWNIWELETGLIPLMCDMRQRGVRVDVDRAEQAKRLFKQKSEEIKAEIHRLTGVKVEPWAAASVATVFDAIGLEYPTIDARQTDMFRKSGGVPSFTKQWLAAHNHPVAKMIMHLREVDKADSTFIDSILRHEHDGRIHTEFHQLRSDDGGTVTGRFSSSNPNLQQIPARDPEIKKAIRGLFLPEEGQMWASFDYSSQEPRLLVHFAASMPDSQRSPVVDNIVEEYHQGDVDLHQMVADIAGITRKQAKVVNLGIMYGMGVVKLADQLGVSKEEAKSIIEEHETKVPFVKRLAVAASQRAEDNGQIRTILGRLCRFDMWEPRTFGYNQPLKLEEAKKVYGTVGNNLKRAFTYKALNKLIQGSAADQTKKAMADCYAAGLVPLLTVHDELCFSVEGEQQAAQIKEIMETGLPLKIPSKVDVDVPAMRGLPNNWGEVE